VIGTNLDLMEGKRLKILTVVGARPQIIKAAAISRAIKRSFNERIHEVILHTGQHYDSNMSEVFFSELGIPAPDYNLNVGSGMHGGQTALMITGIEKILIAEKPDVIILFGDTNSTLAGAIAASKLHVPVAHIEAGLRSYNKSMPEEINRIMCDHASTWLFVPTFAGIKNLRKEGFDAQLKVFFKAQAKEVLETQTKEVFETHAKEVLETQTKEAFETHAKEVLETQTKEAFETQTKESLDIKPIVSSNSDSFNSDSSNLDIANINITTPNSDIISHNSHIVVPIIANSIIANSIIADSGIANSIIADSGIANSIIADSGIANSRIAGSGFANTRIYSSGHANVKFSIDNPGVFHTGDVMYDNSMFFSDLAEERAPLSGILRKFFENGVRSMSAAERAGEWTLKRGEYVLATIHRDNNTDNPERLNAIFRALVDIADGVPSQPAGGDVTPAADGLVLGYNRLVPQNDVPTVEVEQIAKNEGDRYMSSSAAVCKSGGCTVVVPLHPRTEKMLERILDPMLYERVVRLRDRILSGDKLSTLPDDHHGVLLLPPASFFEMISLEKSAMIVITDSGGVQKEAFFFRKPCLILRPETEWVEIVECGAAKLVDADYDRILNGYRELLDKQIEYPDIFGDARAAESILQILLESFTTLPH